MTKQIKCPWCNNIYSSPGLFNNHFFDEDLEDIHTQNKDYKEEKRKQLINMYYTKLELQEQRKKTLKNMYERERRGDLSIWEKEDILESLK
jgi:abortive infection bacteriophage resistance protein